jgi:pectate lyase
MHFQAYAILAIAGYTSAQTLVGKAYGFASGVTGGGAAAAVTPKDGTELAKLLSDDVARTIILDKTFDFTGTKKTTNGCQRKECSVAKGGQYFLGALSCGGSDVTLMPSIEYDAASDTPLVIGSNKSILGVGGKGVIKGKGLRIKENAKNIIIQGITITQINPHAVWGGDAIDIKGGNSIWIDHCKFSLIGRMFVVSHFAANKITLSNNEFDGVTTTSSTCNGDHYWTMMFIAAGDQITLDRNYFHDVSGRAPKFDGQGTTMHATNNYFASIVGHAFEANTGTNALIEGNAFKGVKGTVDAANVANVYTVANGGAACQSALGRACVANVADAASGKLVGGENAAALTVFGRVKANLVAPVAASGVAALVQANAGPSKLGAGVAPAANAPASAVAVAPIAATSSAAAPVSAPAAPAPAAPAPAAPAPAAPAPVAPAPIAPAPVAPAPVAPVSGSAAKLYYQCGGQGWTGPSACEAGSTCKVQNPWYSQCLATSARARRHIRENNTE